MRTEPAPKIRLLAVDLDGTLLTSDKRISPATVEALRAAGRDVGVHVVLASARPPRTVLPFYEQLGLDTPMINYNGALVYDPRSRRVLMHLPIPLKTAREIVRLARKLHREVLVSAEIMDRWYTDRLDSRYLTETAKLFGPDQVAPIGKWLTEAVTKLLFLAARDKITELGRRIAEALPHQVSMVQTEGHLLQVMHVTVSKAQALRCVAAELCVERENVMAIGDNANDVGMLQWAAIGVAVGNATPEVKAVAQLVTGGNDEDGVAEAVRQLILGHRGRRPRS
jgi:5-amino-6-(5-phospho-D-ribitylamino)uracil phosphatase